MDRVRRIWILTMFPEYFAPMQEYGVLGRALRNEAVDQEGNFELHCLRIPDYSPKDFKGVDAPLFGGGAGMAMRADVLKSALLDGVVKKGNYDLDRFRESLHIVYTAPRGKTWNHAEAVKFAKNYLDFESGKDIVFICGRYEGVDERFLENYVDQFISIGDFILTGGELAVMTIIDSALRFVPGVLGNKLSAVEESFAAGQIEQPLYTRPRIFEGKEVPAIYLSGHHKNISAHNKTMREQMTKEHRPDLTDSSES